jgi:hypothetical protein
VTVAARVERARRALAVLVACAAPLVHPPDGARAQTADRAIEFEDLGLTGFADPGARTSALAASAARVADAAALVVNPAGLARIKRPHADLALAWRRREQDTRYAGASRSATLDAFGLEFAGAAFPIPVLRGSLVPAVSVHRAFSSDLELRYQGHNVPDGRDDTYYLQQSGTTYAYSIGAALDLADAISLGGTVSLLHGHVNALRQYDYHVHGPSPLVRTYVLEEADLDVTGWVGRLGIEIYAHRHLHLGVVFASPQPIDVDGPVVTEITEQVQNSVGSFSRETTTASTEYLLPYRIDVALAAPWSRVAFSAQYGYADWSQAAIDGRRVRTQGGETVLRVVHDVRGGVEWAPPVRGLRLRAGIAHALGALEFVEADRVDNDRLERVVSESGRTRVSLGAGWMVGARLSVDAAFEHARGERDGDTVGDSVESAAVVVQGSYWF